MSVVWGYHSSNSNPPSLIATLLAYPDRYPNTTETLDQELHHLKQKVDAGADYIVTQLFFDVDRFLSWQAKVRAKGL